LLSRPRVTTCVPSRDRSHLGENGCESTQHCHPLAPHRYPVHNDPDRPARRTPSGLCQDNHTTSRQLPPQPPSVVPCPPIVCHHRPSSLETNRIEFAPCIPSSTRPCGQRCGSNKYGAVAQLGERCVRNAEVGSSILLRSTIAIEVRLCSGLFLFRRSASTGAASGLRAKGVNEAKTRGPVVFLLLRSPFPSFCEERPVHDPLH
jgi:hypothetical protein